MFKFKRKEERLTHQDIEELERAFREISQTYGLEETRLLRMAIDMLKEEIHRQGGGSGPRK
ncbi:MAG: hypothetical protein QW650_00915 [Thermofilum sp.]